MKWKSDQNNQPRISPKDNILISTHKDNSIDQKTSSLETRNTNHYQTRIFALHQWFKHVDRFCLITTHKLFVFFIIFLTTLGSTLSEMRCTWCEETYTRILINTQSKTMCMICCMYDLYVLTKENSCQSNSGNIWRS